MSMETFLHEYHDLPGSQLSCLPDWAKPSTIHLYTRETWGLHLTHKFIRLMHLTLSQFLGYFNRKLVSLLRAQGSVDDSGLQDSRAKWRWFIWCLIVFVSELLVDSWVLDHIGWRGGVKNQAQDNDEEWQQIETRELKHRDRAIMWRSIYAYMQYFIFNLF